MHPFVHIAGIGTAVIVVLICPQSSALAQDYLNSPYQSEQFRYQEQQRNRERDEFYNRQRQQYQEQQLERRDLILPVRGLNPTVRSHTVRALESQATLMAIPPVHKQNGGRCANVERTTAR